MTFTLSAGGSSGALVPSCAVAGMSSLASSVYTGQYSGCDHCMDSMFVSWLGIHWQME